MIFFLFFHIVREWLFDNSRKGNKYMADMGSEASNAINKYFQVFNLALQSANTAASIASELTTKLQMPNIDMIINKEIQNGNIDVYQMVKEHNSDDARKIADKLKKNGVYVYEGSYDGAYVMLTLRSDREKIAELIANDEELQNLVGEREVREFVEKEYNDMSYTNVAQAEMEFNNKYGRLLSNESKGYLDEVAKGDIEVRTGLSDLTEEQKISVIQTLKNKGFYVADDTIDNLEGIKTRISEREAVDFAITAWSVEQLKQVNAIDQNTPGRLMNVSIEELNAYAHDGFINGKNSQQKNYLAIGDPIHGNEDEAQKRKSGLDKYQIMMFEKRCNQNNIPICVIASEEGKSNGQILFATKDSDMMRRISMSVAIDMCSEYRDTIEKVLENEDRINTEALRELGAQDTTDLVITDKNGNCIRIQNGSAEISRIEGKDVNGRNIETRRQFNKNINVQLEEFTNEAQLTFMKMKEPVVMTNSEYNQLMNIADENQKKLMMDGIRRRSEPEMTAEDIAIINKIERSRALMEQKLLEENPEIKPMDQNYVSEQPLSTFRENANTNADISHDLNQMGTGYPVEILDDARVQYSYVDQLEMEMTMDDIVKNKELLNGEYIDESIMEEVENSQSMNMDDINIGDE